MIETIKVCDRCGRKQKPDLDISDILIIMNGPSPIEDLKLEFDLCPSCREDLNDYIRAFQKVQSISSSAHMGGNTIMPHG